MPDQLAVTWKVGTRYVTAIGVSGLEEIASLMAVVNQNVSHAGGVSRLLEEIASLMAVVNQSDSAG